ncbi:MAG: hypothetical protein WC044_09605 [Crocinitomicaceae bacterium]
MKVISILILTAVLMACKSESAPQGTQTEEIATLQTQIEQMKLDDELKDSMINESLSFFNEIQDNLISIGIKKESVRLKSANPELGVDEKAMVLQEIKHINFLREENAKKVTQMQETLKASGFKIVELENMIKRLVEDIAAKDEQIASLQEELEQKDKDYSLLFDAYQQKAYQLENLSDEMNTAFYVYGSDKELEKNGVVELKNGFIGIGKKLNLKVDFNEDYFTKIDVRSKKEFIISGNKIQIVSTHPTASYKLQESGNNTKLTITDIRSFWKVTKYLIVVVK